MKSNKLAYFFHSVSPYVPMYLYIGAPAYQGFMRPCKAIDLFSAFSVPLVTLSPARRDRRGAGGER